MATLLTRVSSIVAACALGACWLTSSFDGLTNAGGASDASPESMAMDAGSDALPLDAGVDATTDTSDAAPDGPFDVRATDADASTADGPPPDASCSTSMVYSESVLAEKPLAYWRFDEDAGPTAHDVSGNAHDGTYQGGVGLGAAGALKNDPDTAASFDGTSGLVDMGAVFPFLMTSPFSVEAWIYPTHIDGEYRGLLSNESATTSPRYGYLMWLESLDGGSVGFERWDNASSNPTKASGMTANQWFHVVGTFDGSALFLYVNGVQRDTATSVIVSISQANKFVVGALYGGTMPSNFQGTIDEVAVYDHALAPPCVQAHYHLGSGM